MLRFSSRGEFGALWRRPRYPGFVCTVALSRTSATMFNTAGVLLILARTHSAPLAGAVAAASVIPGAVSGPVLGAWLDVATHRRRLIVCDQLLSVVGLVLILTLAGHAPDWVLPLVTIVYSITRPFSSGSFFSALAEIAGPALLDEASAIEATSLNLSVIVGPALAGILSGVVGPAATVEVQVAATLVVALLIALNPAFEARSVLRSPTVRDALRTGVGSLVSTPMLRFTTLAACFAGFGWGLMVVGFPAYVVAHLHSPANASGWMWAAIAGGSIIGTFVLHGDPTAKRVALSYGALGLSALLWPLASSLLVGVVLVTFTGVLEGPAYSGWIALRQRHTPPGVRAQVMTTLTGIGQLVFAVGGAIGGAVNDADTLIVALWAVNMCAAAAAWSGRAAQRQAQAAMESDS